LVHYWQFIVSNAFHAPATTENTGFMLVVHFFIKKMNECGYTDRAGKIKLNFSKKF